MVGLDAASAFDPRVLRIMQRRDEIRAAVERLEIQVGPHTPSRTPSATAGSIPIKCVLDARGELAHLWDQQALLHRDVVAIETPIAVARWMSGGALRDSDPLVDQARRASEDAFAAIKAVQLLVDEATGAVALEDTDETA